MATTKYFYKDASLGVFVIDNTVVSTKSGIMSFHTSNTVVSITSVDTNKVILEPIEITNLLKQNAAPYTNKAELLTATKDFFL